jgi:hypothetical protein
MMGIFDLREATKPVVTIVDKLFGCPRCKTDMAPDEEFCEECLIWKTKFVDLYKLNNDELITAEELANYNIINKSEF